MVTQYVRIKQVAWQ